MSLILFDFDGVIIDSEPLHSRAKQMTLEHFRLRWPLRLFSDYKGRPDSDFFQYVSVELAGGVAAIGGRSARPRPGAFRPPTSVILASACRLEAAGLQLVRRMEADCSWPILHLASASRRIAVPHGRCSQSQSRSLLGPRSPPRQMASNCSQAVTTQPQRALFSIRLSFSRQRTRETPGPPA